MTDIDFVLPYVDGSDPVWRAEKDRYFHSDSGEMSDASECRYRDWGTLKYFFRGVEQYAPWIRKLFFIVSGEEQIPSWLNRSDPRLEIVFHKDFIPAGYLPTFSSNCIELNLHRIKGLSEHFVYFNDDVFLINNVTPEFFFKKGLPCDTAILRFRPFMELDPGRKPFLSALASIAAINRNYDKRSCMRRYLYKWLDPKMGIRIVSTLWLLPAAEFTGFTNLHIMNPYLKSTFEEVWDKEGEVLEQTCMHRFREPYDVNQYIFQYWQFASGSFTPRAHEVGRSRTINRKNMDDIKRIMSGGKYKAISLNDSELPADEFEQLREELDVLFSLKYPEKSSYEK